MIIDEDIYDYIVVNLPIISEILENSQDICVEVVDDQWIIVHSALPDNRELNISSLGYYTIPKYMDLWKYLIYPIEIVMKELIYQAWKFPEQCR